MNEDTISNAFEDQYSKGAASPTHTTTRYFY